MLKPFYQPLIINNIKISIKNIFDSVVLKKKIKFLFTFVIYLILYMSLFENIYVDEQYEL